MGYMGNGAHEHKIINTAGILTTFLQYIDMDVSKYTSIFPWCFELIVIFDEFEIGCLLLACLLKRESLTPSAHVHDVTSYENEASSVLARVVTVWRIQFQSNFTPLIAQYSYQIR